jgi:hypothetical protein
LLLRGVRCGDGGEEATTAIVSQLPRIVTKTVERIKNDRLGASGQLGQGRGRWCRAAPLAPLVDGYAHRLRCIWDGKNRAGPMPVKGLMILYNRPYTFMLSPP